MGRGKEIKSGKMPTIIIMMTKTAEAVLIISMTSDYIDSLIIFLKKSIPKIFEIIINHIFILILVRICF